VTTIAAPPRRARTGTRSTTARTTTARTTSTRTTARRNAPRAKAAPRAVAQPLAIGRIGVLLAIVTMFALVMAVVFHVVLAQNQMELDRLNVQIAKEQRVYEQRRLTTSLLASPQRVIQEAERLGLVLPPEPAQYLYVPDAPMPRTDDGSTAETITDWSKTKSSLGPQQP
jgi:cell division protein FtsL